MAWPEELSINAWAGGDGAVSGPVGPDALEWALTTPLPEAEQYLLAMERPDPRRWRDPGVGWGLVLPENEAVSAADRAIGADAPEPVRQLLADRQDAPILRYVANSPHRFDTLRRYYTNRAPRDLDIAASDFGVADDRIPQYLLICGSPAIIPWDLQYVLNTRFAVGRLDLDDQGLENYVSALRKEWEGAAAQPFHAVVWATEHGALDMSATMKSTIAGPVFQKLSADTDVGPGAVFLQRSSGGATGATLTQALSERHPGLVVTTSHGVTGPAPDAQAMAHDLGLLVDEDFHPVRPEDLLGSWQPDGAIWYAHACCSAGASGETVYEGLLSPDSDISKVLLAVAGLGSMTAPFPRSLLGNAKPARAFIGHVEPTFDWTIREPATRQPLTAAIQNALYENLYQPDPFPIGLAFGPYWSPIGTLAAEQATLRRKFDRGEQVNDQLLDAQLAARDRMSMVILGDPTAVLAFPTKPPPEQP
jgi:hypothetical protein